MNICRNFKFEAAHFLPHHTGKCRNIHGHSFRLEIEISGEKHRMGPETGMILDFSNLKEVVEQHVLDKYDHHCINDFIRNPTAENIVLDIAQRLNDVFQRMNIIIERIQLWETDHCSAKWVR